MQKRNLGSLFLREKPAKALLLLKKAENPIYASVITKEIDTTYAHTLNVLSKLAELELVTFEEIGRIKLVRLTELGAGVADVLETFTEMMGLVNIKKKIERVHQKEVQGRVPAKINRARVSKRLARYKSELQRLGGEKPKIKENVENLVKRINEILAKSRRQPKQLG